ncbi:hypothetical protein MVEN_00332600 [Mycena venus]|uniref:Uncharacterized protein n=1 Tax=Mycena venus TaxID=2733690 RepID=A0A8H7DA94_9AGAR|nr:hypothetical protein MVEN_00332600 [Mycena venus]
MSHQSIITELRVNNIITCLKPVIPLLNEVGHSFGTPFVQAIANTTVSLIDTFQTGGYGQPYTKRFGSSREIYQNYASDTGIC